MCHSTVSASAKEFARQKEIATRTTVSALLGLLLFFPVESLVGQEPALKDTEPQKPAAGKQAEQQFAGKKNPREKLGYLLYLSKDYGKKNTPLLLFLHGSGEHGIGKRE